jgi:predicted phosphoribosyltransferase
MLFFKNRYEAGKTLGGELAKYQGQKNAFIALGDGSIPVCKAILETVPGVLTMLITEAIVPPGEDFPVGYIDQDGAFVPNKLLSESEREYYEAEYRNYIEGEKLEKLHMTTALSGGTDIFPHAKLHDYNIIMVSDGFSSGPLLDSLVDLLKPIRIKNFSIAVPVACVTTVDRMHEYSQDVHALGIADFYMGPNHYFQDNTLPEHKDALNDVATSIANWQF